MINNLNLTRGLIFSQELMLSLTKAGLSRDKAYQVIQNHSKISLSSNKNLIDLVKKDSFITSKIPIKQIENI